MLSSEKNIVPVEESAPIQKILLKSLTQSGYVIPNDLLSGDFVEVNSDYSKSKSLHVIKKLENLLNLLSLKPEREPDDESLKSLVKNSGLMWEKKLSSVIKSLKEPLTLRDAENLINNDIKALAMKLAMIVDGEDKNIRNTLRSFVDGIEKMQILNTHSSEESGRYLLPLPFFLNDTLKFGQLLVDLDRNSKSDGDTNDRAIRVAFILEMTRLGHLKADFSIYKKSISGEFGVENDEVQKLFNQLIPGLKEKFEEKEYVVNKIGCSVISSGELAGTSLTDLVIDNPSGVINIVV